MLRNLYTALALTVTLALSNTPYSYAQALGDQWFLGIGGGLSSIEPEADADGEASTLEDDEGSVWNLLIGRDFDHLSSGQLQLFSLGEAGFSNEDTVEYQGVEAALLYRFYDSRDKRRLRSPFSPSRSSYLGFSLYGRFGVGYLERDSRSDLRDDTPAYFGVGAGVEGYVTRNLGVRLEARYLDVDATATSLSLIGRFGGYKSRLLSSVILPTRSNEMQREQVTERATELAAEQAARQDAERLAQRAAQQEAERIAQRAAQQEAERIAQRAAQQEAERIAQRAAQQEALANSRTEPSPSATYQRPETTTPTELSSIESRIDDTRSNDPPLVTVTPDAVPADTPDIRGRADKEIREPILVAPASNGNLLSTAPVDDKTIPATSDAIAGAQPAVQNQPGASREIPSTQDLNQNSEFPTTSAELAFADSDADGVMNAEDRCPASTRGFPVNVAGCSVFFGELDGIEFSDDNREIVGDTTQSLDAYAALLQRFPQSRIEIVAHTDNSGTKAEQSLRTRTRLRTLGLYLVEKGATSDQLILRSFGANRPRTDNTTEAGRIANNRIEIFERPRP